MKRTKFISTVVVILLLLALPATVLANKQVYKAVLNSTVGSDGRGSFTLSHNPDATFFITLNAHSLSSPVISAHIRSTVDDSILVTVCNSATPQVGVPLCTPAPAGGNSVLVQTSIVPQMMLVGGGQFNSLLTGSLTYVTVETSLYPGGEVSGALLPR